MPGYSLPGSALKMHERGRSRGGITTKILALTDALGNLVDFCLMPGQAHDLRETNALVCGLSAGHLLADRAFDADWLRDDLLARDITPVIPPTFSWFASKPLPGS